MLQKRSGFVTTRLLFPVLLFFAALGSCLTMSSSSSSSNKASPYPPIQVPPAGDTIMNNKKHDAVPGIMNYVDPSVTVAHVHRDEAGDDGTIHDCKWKPVRCAMHNARTTSCDLDTQGCELITTAPSSPWSVDPALDFTDSAVVMDQYYPSCEKLLAERLGSKIHVVKAFDHNIRMAEQPSQQHLKHAGTANVQVPIGIVHGDYTLVSAPRRIQALAQPPKVNDVWKTRLADGQSLLDPTVVQQAVDGKRRYALINVWRSIDPEHPVTSFPLAFCNAQTVERSDLRTLQLHYTDRVGENYWVAPSDEHEWWYYPKMLFDEAMLIKQWDSLADPNNNKLAPFAIHSAFAPPPVPDARPRKSIEVRCVCIWEPDEDEQ